MYNDRLFWLLRAALANPDQAAGAKALQDLQVTQSARHSLSKSRSLRTSVNFTPSQGRRNS